MKTYLSLFAAILVSCTAQSQEISDALRYAQDDLNGTARFRAMGGAFGALGGDMSSLNVNPAGSAVFMNNQVSLTLTSYNTSNKSDYFGTNTSEEDYAFDLNQAGGVYVLTNDDEESDWKKLTLALNYDNVHNFDNTIFTAGVNPTNSIANYFLTYANNFDVTLDAVVNDPYETLDFAEWQTLFGYEGYVINPPMDTPEDNLWVSNVPAGGNYYHENSFISTGYNGKLTFNVAAQYQKWLFIGLNLNSHFADYQQSTSFYESNSNDAAQGLQRVRFNNDLATYGSGFSFQLGGIARVTDAFRVGVSYESPTWYRMEDEFTQSISFSAMDAETEINNFFDPRIVLVSTYKIQTPSKWTGSLAYVFGQSGLISFDFAIKDYSNTNFRPERDFMEINDIMSEVLDMSSEFRIGAEKKIKKWSLRAGYRFEQSPYKNGRTIGDLNAISGGLGYNFGDTKIDLSYTHARRDYEQGFFSRGLTDPAKIESVNNNVSLSVIFEL